MFVQNVIMHVFIVFLWHWSQIYMSQYFKRHRSPTLDQMQGPIVDILELDQALGMQKWHRNFSKIVFAPKSFIINYQYIINHFFIFSIVLAHTMGAVT